MISARLWSMQDQSLLELEVDSQRNELCFVDNDSLTPEARQNLTRTRTSSDDKHRTSETSHTHQLRRQASYLGDLPHDADCPADAVMPDK